MHHFWNPLLERHLWLFAGKKSNKIICSVEFLMLDKLSLKKPQRRQSRVDFGLVAIWYDPNVNSAEWKLPHACHTGDLIKYFVQFCKADYYYFNFFFCYCFCFVCLSLYLRGWQFAAALKVFLLAVCLFFCTRVNRGRERWVCSACVSRRKCNSSLPASSWNRLTVCKDPVLFWRLGREERGRMGERGRGEKTRPLVNFEEMQAINYKERGENKFGTMSKKIWHVEQTFAKRCVLSSLPSL